MDGFQSDFETGSGAEDNEASVRNRRGASPGMLMLDCHADTAQRFVDEEWGFANALGHGHLNLNSARAGGLSGEFFAIWPEPKQWAGRYAHRTLALINGVRREVARHPGLLRLCLSADDVLEAHRESCFAVLMGIEGGHAIENSLALLRDYFALGVRYMTLTWANTNEWADSSGDLRNPEVQHHGGLTEFGREVVCEMNRLGMMVDISHVSDSTFADVLLVSKAPVVASHSNARALTDSPRNLTDSMLRAVAESGGATMANFYPAFLSDPWRKAWSLLDGERRGMQTTLEAEYAARRLPVPYAASNEIDRRCASRLSRPPISALLDHIDHMVNVAGIDHVGFGSDFDGVSALPEGIDSARDLPRVLRGLEKRGYTASNIEKIAGANLLRVMRDVQGRAG